MEAQKKEGEKRGETKKKRQLLRLVKGNGGEDEEGERKEGSRGRKSRGKRKEKGKKEKQETESTKNRKVERDTQDIVGNPIQDS